MSNVTTIGLARAGAAPARSAAGAPAPRSRTGGVSGEGAEGLPAFMALDLSGIEGVAPECVQALTPRVMRWSDDIWLLDLALCESYWTAQAAARGVGVLALLQTILTATVAAPSPRAALASHPWQALLLVHRMRERRLSGLVTAQGPFGASLYKDVTWDVWWACAELLVEHMAASGRSVNRPLYRRQREQMRRSVDRLGLKAPWQLRDATPEVIKRRFGALMRDVWEWAFDPSSSSSSGRVASSLCGSSADAFPSGRRAGAALPGAPAGAAAFPWRAHVWPVQPAVQRHLDFALVEWGHIESFLREDLNRLCALPSWQHGERVVSLEWRLVFHDLSHLVIPIRFRHPHLLHLERGSHATALLQALYSFESHVPRNARAHAAPIVGWHLAVAERLTIPGRALGLFGEQDAEELALLQLENKLPIRLESYDLKHDWLPEDSFLAGCGAADAAQAHSIGSLAAVAQARPLFLYRKPAVFDSRGASSSWQFLERTMSKWWVRGQSAQNLQRDYYRLTDREQRSYWVYRDTLGQCFIHGVFA